MSEIDQASADMANSSHHNSGHPPQFTGILTPEGIVVAISSSSLKFIAAKENEVIGKAFWQTPWWRHSKTLQQKLRDAVATVKETGLVCFEATHRDADGRLFVLDFSLQSVIDDNGDILYLIPSARDITELKNLELEHQETEAGYKKIFKSISDIIFIADQNGFFKDMNESACRTYGYSKEEFTGMHASIIVHPDSHHVLEKFFQDLVASDHFEGQTKERRKDGTTFYADVKGSKIQFKGEECFLAIVRDITERKKAEETLREREQLYQSLFKKNISMMMLIDPESSRIFDANPAACSFYGYTQKQFKRLKLYDISILPRNIVRRQLHQARSEQQNYFNSQHRLADGSIRDVEVFIGPIEEKGRSFLCSIIHDVSVRRKMEREREELIADLQNALDEIKTLRGILPICSNCKKIRDDKGYWNQIESYIDQHSEASFTHGICPDCVKELYPDYAHKLFKKK